MAGVMHGIQAASWTKSGGSPVTIGSLITAELSLDADMRMRGSSGELYQTIAYAENLRASGNVVTNDATLMGNASIVVGTAGKMILKFPQRVTGTGYGTTQNVTATIGGTAGCVLGPIRHSGSHDGQDSGRLTIPFVAVSADGTTSPVAFAVGA